jgi:hypothetical protein
MFMTGQLGHVNYTHCRVGGPYDILLKAGINLYVTPSRGQPMRRAAWRSGPVGTCS